jgi:hypothetical protein
MSVGLRAIMWVLVVQGEAWKLGERVDAAHEEVEQAQVMTWLDDVVEQSRCLAALTK